MSSPLFRQQLFIIVILVLLVQLNAMSRELGFLKEFNQIHHENKSKSSHAEISLPGGRIRTLFIAPRFTMRDVVELSSRIELDYDCVYLWDSHHVGYDPNTLEYHITGASENELQNRLLDLLHEKFDLIVIGNTDLSILSIEIFEALEQRLIEGTGLIVSCYGSNIAALENQFEEITPCAVPNEIVRGLNKYEKEVITCYTLGKGNIAVIQWPGVSAQTHFILPSPAGTLDELHFDDDCCYLMPMRVIRWASGRKAQVYVNRIDNMGSKLPDESEVPPGMSVKDIQEMQNQLGRTFARPYDIKLNTFAAADYTVKLRLRRQGRPSSSTISMEQIIPKGVNHSVIYLPVGAGKYDIKVNLLDKRDRLVDWYADSIETSGWPEFSGLTCSKSFLWPNDTLNLSTWIKPPAIQARPITIYTRAIDSLNRIVAEKYQDLSKEAGPVEISLNFADLIARLVRIEMFAVDGKGRNFDETWLSASAFASIHLPVRVAGTYDDFSFMVTDDVSDEHNASKFNNILADYGVDTFYTCGNAQAGILLADANMGPLFEIAQYEATSDRDGMIRNPCLTDPQYLDVEKTKLKGKTESLWPYGTSLYSIGSGNCIIQSEENVCQSSTCLEGFRGALESQYITLDSLNATWHTGYTSWDEVRPCTREKAIDTGHYAPWIDFRKYMVASFTHFNRDMCETVRTTDRDAKVGYKAIERAGIYTGYDWSSLAPELDVTGIPPDLLTVEKVRSYKSSQSYAGIYFGGDVSPHSLEHARWFPWYNVLHDMTVAWFDASYGTSELDTPFVALTPGGSPFSTFKETAKEVNRLKSGIGKLLMHSTRINSGIAIYDSASTFYLDHLNTPDQFDMKRSQEMCIRVVEDLGYQYDLISSKQAEQGGLRNYQLLILPAIRALSQKENLAIDEFCINNVVVVTKQSETYYDDHGSPGNLPAWLNSPNMSLIEREEDSQVEESLYRSLKDIIIETGIQKVEYITTSKDKLFEGECIGYHYGKATIIALLKDPDASEGISKLKLHLQTDNHVYNMLDTKRQQKNAEIQNPKKIPLKLAKGGVALFASLPYEVTELDLQVPQFAKAGRRLPITVKIETKGDTPGEHIVHIDVTAPGSEKPVTYYAQNLTCYNSTAQTYIPLSINEIAGKYTIQARDVMTGTSKQAFVQIIR